MRGNGKQVQVDDARGDANRRASDAFTRRAEDRADKLEHNRLAQQKDAVERDRHAAHDARHSTIEGGRLKTAEKLANARIDKLNAEPHKASQRFGGDGAKNKAQDKPPKAKKSPKAPDAPEKEKESEEKVKIRRRLKPRPACPP